MAQEIPSRIQLKSQIGIPNHPPAHTQTCEKNCSENDPHRALIPPSNKGLENPKPTEMNSLRNRLYIPHLLGVSTLIRVGQDFDYSLILFWSLGPRNHGKAKFQSNDTDSLAFRILVFVRIGHRLLKQRIPKLSFP